MITADGTYTLSVTATDTAGNVSPATTRSFSVDAIAPDAPTIGSATLTGDTTPTIFGTAEAGGTVTVKNGTTTLCTATTSVTGDWTCDVSPALADGNYTLSVTATDAAGNQSNPTTQSLEIDSTLPAAPTITSPSITNISTPTIFGTAEPGSTVVVMIDGQAACTVIANGSGVWTCNVTPALAEGDHNVSVTARDVAVNTSPAATQILTIDLTPPTKPTITQPSGATTDSKPTISGTGEPGSTATVTIDGQVVCSTVVSQAGTWSCTPTTSLSDGNHQISVRTTDAAGNSSATEATLTVNTQTLMAPIINPTAPPAPSQGSSNRFPIITGTGPADSIVTIVIDPDRNPATNNSITYEVPVDANGGWTLNTMTATPTAGTLSQRFTIGEKLTVTATARKGGATSETATQTVTIAYVAILPIILVP